MRNPRLTFIVNAIKAAGGTVPKAITEADSAQQRVVEEARRYRGKEGGYTVLAEAWANAVIDGRDPADDREVFRAMLNDAIMGGDMEYAAANAVESRLIAQLPEVQGSILQTFKTGFDAAGRTLKEAHSILGGIDINDTVTIFQLGSSAVQAYQDAQEARRIVRVINQGWESLNELTRFAPIAEPATVWTDSDIDTWEKIRRLKDGWGMTVAGATLDLAIDRDTIKQRHQRLNIERTERDNAPEEERKAFMRAQGAEILKAMEQARASIA